MSKSDKDWIMRSTKPKTLAQKAEKALKQAVRKVVKEHERAGVPLIVWKNGKVVRQRVTPSK